MFDSKLYTKEDMEAAFIAGRLMTADNIKYFVTFKDFHIWYKVTMDHQKIMQLEQETKNETI